MKCLLLATATALMIATPALAQDASYPDDQTAFEEMRAGDFDAAEAKLLRTARTDVGARINLAQIFAADGRESEALVLLRSVKSNEDIVLEGAEGQLLSSHEVADVLLDRMGAVSDLAASER